VAIVAGELRRDTLFVALTRPCAFATSTSPLIVPASMSAVAPSTVTSPLIV